MSSETVAKSAGYNGKVFNRLKKPTSHFSWRIKFPDEIPLSIIPPDNFYITDKSNTMCEFEIKVERATNSVIIIPYDKFNSNVYYFLHIKKFEYGRGRSAKTLPPIHVGFKVQEEAGLDLIWYKGGFNPDTVMNKALKVKEKRSTSVKQEYLGKKAFTYNTNLSLFIAIVTAIKVLIFDNLVNILNLDQQLQEYAFIGVTGFAIIGSIFQLVIFSAEFKGKKRQSVDFYNVGVVSYNAGRYHQAEGYFNNAIVADPNNQYAERAIDINNKFLSKDVDALMTGNVSLEKMKFVYNKSLIVVVAVMNFLYCSMAAFDEMQWISIASSEIVGYLKIFFITTLVLHFIFLFVQSKSLEHSSVVTYNKGVDVFEEGDMDAALLNFKMAYKQSHSNSHAFAAKELVPILQLREQRRKYREEKEQLLAAAAADKEKSKRSKDDDDYL